VLRDCLKEQAETNELVLSALCPRTADKEQRSKWKFEAGRVEKEGGQ